MKRMIVRTLAAAALLTTTAAVLATPRQDGKGRYAEVNGLKMYYEIYGTGKPLVLLHGAFGWATVFPTLAKNRQVIAIELQGHGHTADINRPLTYEQMADDTAALLKQLKIEQADSFGYSMGGNVALAVAIRHPKLVRNWSRLDPTTARSRMPTIPKCSRSLRAFRPIISRRKS